MSDKILYQPTEGTTGFWGLRGYPERPVRLTGEWETSWQAILDQYFEALESCKSNKLEIVNPELILSIYPCVIGGVTEAWRYHKTSMLLKPGDIFDLPSNYEFKEEEKDGNKVLRLQKIPTECVPQPEPEESQEVLADELVNVIWNLGETNSHFHCKNYIKENYVIQRKKL